MPPTLCASALPSGGRREEKRSTGQCGAVASLLQEGNYVRRSLAALARAGLTECSRRRRSACRPSEGCRYDAPGATRPGSAPSPQPPPRRRLEPHDLLRRPVRRAAARELERDDQGRRRRPARHRGHRRRGRAGRPAVHLLRSDSGRRELAVHRRVGDDPHRLLLPDDQRVPVRRPVAGVPADARRGAADHRRARHRRAAGDAGRAQLAGDAADLGRRRRAGAAVGPSLAVGPRGRLRADERAGDRGLHHHRRHRGAAGRRRVGLHRVAVRARRASLHRLHAGAPPRGVRRRAEPPRGSAACSAARSPRAPMRSRCGR